MAGPLGAQRPHPRKGVGKPTVVRPEGREAPRPVWEGGRSQPRSQDDGIPKDTTVAVCRAPPGHQRWGGPRLTVASPRVLAAPSSPRARSASLTSRHLPLQDGNSAHAGAHAWAPRTVAVDTNLGTPGGPGTHPGRGQDPAAPVCGRARNAPPAEAWTRPPPVCGRARTHSSFS